MGSNKMGPNKDLDRISNLPNDIIENILLHLPIRESMRTSILSHQWRYQWNTIPELVFHHDHMGFPEANSEEELDNKIVRVVDQALLLHQGPIRKFVLSTALTRNVDIDRWILFLSKNGIEKLILDKGNGERYKVSSSLFQCEKLTSLVLFECKVVIPASFRGFKSLTALLLENVTISSKGLEVLISQCPRMKQLQMRNVDGCDRLNIHAKELDKLFITGRHEEVCLNSCPLLAFAYIHLSIGEDQVLEDGDICKLADLFGSLPKIDTLLLWRDSLKIYTSGNVLPRLPATCHLKHLLIELNLDDKQEMLGAFSIFRSSTNLEELHITSLFGRSTYRISSEGILEGQKLFNCFFSRLKTIKIRKVEGVASELKFIEFVLANAPVLKKMGIKFRPPRNDAPDIMKKIGQFQIASQKAEVNLLK